MMFYTNKYTSIYYLKIAGQNIKVTNAVPTPNQMLIPPLELTRSWLPVISILLSQRREVMNSDPGTKAILCSNPIFVSY